MTLKKCTVRQLDDTFWRVDWDGELNASWESPVTVKYEDAWWRLGAYSNRSLDVLLHIYGLTRHNPQPETAEERVIDDSFTPDAAGWAYLDSRVAETNLRACLDGPQPGNLDEARVSVDDLRAILAELDRVRRERDERTEGWRKTERKLAKLSKDMREVSEMLFESKVEVERLRSGMMPAAQRPVDIEAVLAPVRRVLSAYRTAPAYGMKYELLARHVVDDLGQALAEAEKIARGK